MRYYGSLIIFNKHFNEILLIEYKKNKFMLPVIENKTNININFTTICILNDFFHIKKNIYFAFDTFYIQHNDDYTYYMICSINNETIFFDDSEYFDVNFFSFTDIIKKNILNEAIIDNLVKIDTNNINVNIQKIIKYAPDYYNIRKYILYYLRNIKFKSTLFDIFIYVSSKINNITEYDCIISMLFDTKNRIFYRDEYYYCKYRHNKLLLNCFNNDNIFENFSYENSDNKYYLLIYKNFEEYTITNNNIYSNNLEFILINSLDKKITQQIYNKYTEYYEIDIKKCILDNIIFYKIDANTIITLGNNGMLSYKYILSS